MSDISNNEVVIQTDSETSNSMSAFSKIKLRYIGNNTYEKENGTSLLSKRRSKNRDAYQQSFLIYHLLKCGCTIKLEPLYKRGTFTAQMFTIERVSKDSQILYDKEKIQIKWLNMKERRRIIDSISNNCLLTLLSDFAKVSTNEKKCKTCRANENVMRRLKSITINGRRYSIQDIQDLGGSFHDLIRDRMNKDGCILNEL